jgi:hypothetical protein
MPDHNLDRAKEAQLRFSRVAGFLKSAESKYPGLAQELPNMLSGLLGNTSFDPQLMVQNEGYIPGGFAFLGSWLKQNGFGGFEVNSLSLYDQGIKAGAPLKVQLPNRNEFFAKSAVAPENWTQLQNAMVDLSQTVGQALEIGYKPKQVVAALFIQSTAAVGDERPETSIPTREMLIKASGNKLSQVNQILNRWVKSG